MKYKVLFFFFLMVQWSCSLPSKSIENETKTPVKERFPEDWVGNWFGSLDIYNAQGKQQTVAMELEISKIDTSINRYTCALIYGEDRIKGRRPYELILAEPEKGHYINDEKNSILMDEYFIGNVLYCSFVVENNYLTSRFEKIGHTIHYEITVADTRAVSTTGNQIVAGDTIPPVISYRIKSVQKAVLRMGNK
jgi:hypothetical protein